VSEPPLPSLQSPGVRAAIAALVLAVVVLSLAVPLRAWLRQSDENTALAAEVAAREQRIAELDEQLSQWGDPAYVEQQARERLRWVRPGEIGYVVIDPEAEAQQEAETENVGMPGSWYERLWRSYEDSATLDR
jgi:cell division protein FtsB